MLSTSKIHDTPMYLCGFGVFLFVYAYHQAFDDSKAAGRIANMGLEKLGALSAGLGDKLNDNADKALDKARAFDVGRF